MTDTIEFPGQTVAIDGRPGSPLKIFSLPDGRQFATGLFKIADERGFPLMCAIDECVKHGLIPCLEQFVYDAIRAGWPKDRAVQRVREACCDAGYPVPKALQ